MISFAGPWRKLAVLAPASVIIAVLAMGCIATGIPILVTVGAILAIGLPAMSGAWIVDTEDLSRTIAIALASVAAVDLLTLGLYVGCARLFQPIPRALLDVALWLPAVVVIWVGVWALRRDTSHSLRLLCAGLWALAFCFAVFSQPVTYAVVEAAGVKPLAFPLLLAAPIFSMLVVANSLAVVWYGRHARLSGASPGEAMAA